MSARWRPAGRTLVALLAGAVLVAGCAAPGSRSGVVSRDSATGPATGPLPGTVTVFAAASLRETFTDLGQRFEAAHPSVTVRFNFGPSSGLAQAIVRGAPADVFAAASPNAMRQAGDAIGAPSVFARNRLQIAVPPDNPGQIRGLADLADPSVKVALCQPRVPCGAAAARLLDRAGVQVRPVTLEVDVKATLTKVVLGEVDAGLVYVTDARAAKGRVRGIDVPPDLDATTDYPIAVLDAAPNAAAARAFVGYVRSPEAARALAAAGFERP